MESLGTRSIVVAAAVPVTVAAVAVAVAVAVAAGAGAAAAAVAVVVVGAQVPRSHLLSHQPIRRGELQRLAAASSLRTPTACIKQTNLERIEMSVGMLSTAIAPLI